MFKRCQCSLSDSNSSAGFIASDLSNYTTRSRSIGIPDLGRGSQNLPVQFPRCFAVQGSSPLQQLSLSGEGLVPHKQVPLESPDKPLQAWYSHRAWWCRHGRGCSDFKESGHSYVPSFGYPNLRTGASKYSFQIRVSIAKH